MSSNPIEEHQDTSIEGLTDLYVPKKKKLPPGTKRIKKIKPETKTVQIGLVDVKKIKSSCSDSSSDSGSESKSNKTNEENDNSNINIEAIPIPKIKDKKISNIEIIPKKLEYTEDDDEPKSPPKSKHHLEKNDDGYHIIDEEDLEKIPHLKHKKLWAQLLQFSQRIYRQLGTGHTESIYHQAMSIELRNHHIHYEKEKRVLITYEDLKHNQVYTLGEERVDLFLLDYNLIIELKAVTNQPREMELAQIKKYHRELLKAGCYLDEWGLVINFPQPGPTKKARKEVDFVIVRLT